jgi:hypothetical protein
VLLDLVLFLSFTLSLFSFSSYVRISFFTNYTSNFSGQVSRVELPLYVQLIDIL